MHAHSITFRPYNLWACCCNKWQCSWWSSNGSHKWCTICDGWSHWNKGRLCIGACNSHKHNNCNLSRERKRKTTTNKPMKYWKRIQMLTQIQFRIYEIQNFMCVRVCFHIEIMILGFTQMHWCENCDQFPNQTEHENNKKKIHNVVRLNTRINDCVPQNRHSQICSLLIDLFFVDIFNSTVARIVMTSRSRWYLFIVEPAQKLNNNTISVPAAHIKPSQRNAHCTC